MRWRAYDRVGKDLVAEWGILCLPGISREVQVCDLGCRGCVEVDHGAKSKWLVEPVGYGYVCSLEYCMYPLD